MNPTLSIIILSYRNPALLRLCLNSVKKSLDSKTNYEVIVVDNESTEKNRSVVNHEFSHKFSQIKLVSLKKNMGYTRGVNEGIKIAKGDFIFYINHDIVLTPESTENMINYLKKHRDVGLIGPGFLNFNETHQDSCFRFYKPSTILYRRAPYLPFAKRELELFSMKDKDLSIPDEVDWISGAAFMSSREAINKVGLMDEKLFHYFSDVDWSKRFWENGYKVVYFPSSKIYHYHGKGSQGKFGLLEVLVNKQTRWHLNDALKYFGKHGIKNITHKS